jgi:hypothetical protein
VHVEAQIGHQSLQSRTTSFDGVDGATFATVCVVIADDVAEYGRDSRNDTLFASGISADECAA